MANVFWFLRWHVIGDHFIPFWDVVLAQNFAQCFFVYTELVWWGNPRASSTWLRLKFPFFAAGFLGEVHIFGSHQSTNWPQFISYFSQSNPFFLGVKLSLLIKPSSLVKSTVFLHLNSCLTRWAAGATPHWRCHWVGAVVDFFLILVLGWLQEFLKRRGTLVGILMVGIVG